MDFSNATVTGLTLGNTDFNSGSTVNFNDTTINFSGSTVQNFPVAGLSGSAEIYVQDAEPVTAGFKAVWFCTDDTAGGGRGVYTNEGTSGSGNTVWVEYGPPDSTNFGEGTVQYSYPVQLPVNRIGYSIFPANYNMVGITTATTLVSNGWTLQDQSQWELASTLIPNDGSSQYLKFQILLASNTRATSNFITVPSGAIPGIDAGTGAFCRVHSHATWLSGGPAGTPGTSYRVQAIYYNSAQTQISSSGRFTATERNTSLPSNGRGAFQ